MLECRCTEHNLHNNIDKLIILLHNLKLHVFTITVIYTHYVIIIQNQTKPLIYLMIIILNTQQAHCESVNGYSLWPPLTQFIQLWTEHFLSLTQLIGLWTEYFLSLTQFTQLWTEHFLFLTQFTQLWTEHFLSLTQFTQLWTEYFLFLTQFTQLWTEYCLFLTQFTQLLTEHFLWLWPRSLSC